MTTALRPACGEDFDFCARLYFSGMDQIIRDLKLDMTKQEESLRQRWEAARVQIIVSDGCDVGWMQRATLDDALYLEQIFIDAAFQRRGIGTEVINGLIRQAARTGQPVTLGVVKSNPALRLYERLGFRVIDEDDRKFYMRRESGSVAGQ